MRGPAAGVPAVVTVTSPSKVAFREIVSPIAYVSSAPAAEITATASSAGGVWGDASNSVSGRSSAAT